MHGFYFSGLFFLFYLISLSSHKPSQDFHIDLLHFVLGDSWSFRSYLLTKSSVLINIYQRKIFSQVFLNHMSYGKVHRRNKTKPTELKKTWLFHT